MSQAAIDVSGTHVLFFSIDAAADRVFLRDVLGLKSVDAGSGWLIFAMPPTEAAVHPATASDAEKVTQQHAHTAMLGAAVYLMCDDIRAAVRSLAERAVKCLPVEKEPWGLRTSIPLPSGGHIGLYQPTHPTALHLK